MAREQRNAYLSYLQLQIGVLEISSALLSFVPTSSDEDMFRFTIYELRRELSYKNKKLVTSSIRLWHME